MTGTDLRDKEAAQNSGSGQPFWVLRSVRSERRSFMKRSTKRILVMLFCMGMMLLLPKVSFAEETAPPAKPLLTDFGIKNFQRGKNRVVWTHKSPTSMGADGFEIEVSEVKSGKVVSAEELLDFFTARLNVLYRYRIRYYSEASGVPQKVYGEYSDYRYFYAPSLSGKRSSKGFEIKWKKAPDVKGYDCYALASKERGVRTYGKMVATTFVARDLTKEGFKKIKLLGKNSTSIRITKDGKNKLNSKKIYYYSVQPKIYVGGKRVENDLISWVYR